MKDLQKAVETAMVSLNETGAIEKMIEAQLADTIKSIVNDQLRSYSDFGKKLKEKIQKELCIDLHKVTFEEYNQTVLNLVEGQLNNVVTGEAQEKLKRDLSELFRKTPKEITLSQVIEKFMEESVEYDRDSAKKIALIIERKKYGSIGIALHPKGTKGYKEEDITSWTDCDLFMTVTPEDDDDDTRCKLDYTNDRSSLRPHEFMPTCLRGTSRLLYQLYCAGSTLVLDKGLDPEDYDIYYGEDDC